MSILSKPEWDPIFESGLHTLTIEVFSELCVSNFPTSKTRNIIFKGLTNYIDILKSTGLSGELWLDGSFLTFKENPNDIDLVFRFSGPDFDKLSLKEQDILNNDIFRDYSDEFKCDTYYFSDYPEGHAGYGYTMRMRPYWLGLFSFSRSMKPKGIAVIELNGGL